jgi:hypothetical protein
VGEAFYAVSSSACAPRDFVAGSSATRRDDQRPREAKPFMWGFELSEYGESVILVRFTTESSHDFSSRDPLSRRSLGKSGCSMCGPHFYSMKIIKDVRNDAAEQDLRIAQVMDKEKCVSFGSAGDTDESLSSDQSVEHY